MRSGHRPGRGGVGPRNFLHVYSRYGDNVEEMDESLGVVLDALKEYGLEDNTLVYFTSDQGGHLEAIDHDGQRIGGHNGRFKGGKGQGGSEGGIRVPGIFRWPGHLPSGVTIDTPTSLMDLLPTVLSLANLPSLPQLVPSAADKELDGVDISELLIHGKQPEGHRVFLHHCAQYIHAIRLVTELHVYKMHVAKYKWSPGSTQCGWGYNTGCLCFGEEFVTDISSEPELYDLVKDPFEEGQPIDPSTQEYIRVVRSLQNYLKQWHHRVRYAPSQLANVAEIMWRPWLQPQFPF